jgi:hypothetical protein
MSREAQPEPMYRILTDTIDVIYDFMPYSQNITDTKVAILLKI